ncbi:Hsp20/alpha crystallin family protein [Peribacillus glennii]|uniref:Hsp20/alpha crystallin family protein n=1 Tax=Peribacillus glennii TaxID=2303991 RepID=A0A372LGS5_9BACI|nr:Hsp20/alpha crystallin family protein [Peribacillus glennii]RFU65500.1 Hsp20/alpha crystallin family protein [Peribacillus glennii]
MPDSEKNKNRRSSHGQTFNEFMTTMDRLFAEKPIKGLLQSMDDFFGTIERGFPVEIIEKDTHFHIKAALPGVKREQIDIEMLAQGVIISVKNFVQPVKMTGNKTPAKRKQSSKTVSRTITLSKPIDEQRATASHRDGVLEIKVPKLKGKRIAIID